MHEYKLNTPVTLIVFNRPDTTLKVFEEIAKVKPPKLLVISDGARKNCPDDFDKVTLTRSIIDRVNWDCEVLTNFSDTNLGCKNRVSSGIDWVFQQVEESIILEDDCLPHQSFFPFCEELLDRYRHDQRISMIGGTNHLFGYRNTNDSYYYSKTTPIWGWATWRDRWEDSYDVDMKSWPLIKDMGLVDDMVRNKLEAKEFVQNFDRLYQGEVDTWDAQWTFACLLHGRLSIVPNVNLISNIGFHENATHTIDPLSSLSMMEINEIKFPLKHPLGFIESHSLDVRVSRNQSYKEPFWKRTIVRFTQPYLFQRIKKKLLRLL